MKQVFEKPLKIEIASNKSFSLIEILVFVSILSLFFVMAVAVTVTALRNMQYNEHKIIATHYAEELMQWLQNEKETDWNAFTGYFNLSSIYCFNNSNMDWSSNAECNAASYGIVGISPQIFKREVEASNISSTSIDLVVTVDWIEPDSTTPKEVKLNSTFTIWE